MGNCGEKVNKFNEEQDYRTFRSKQIKRLKEYPSELFTDERLV